MITKEETQRIVEIVEIDLKVATAKGVWRGLALGFVLGGLVSAFAGFIL